jgi:ABC-type dipeptide/oligopeptide/nickel transport system ATPase component
VSVTRAAIDALLGAPPRLGKVRVLAIDGPSGSGKSRLADRLVAQLSALSVPTGLVRTDDFATWDDPVAWWPSLIRGVLEPLAAGLPGGYRRTEWTGGAPRAGAMAVVDVPRVLVVEGVSAARRSVRPRLSAIVWCADPSPARRLERAVARDGEACREPLRAWQRFELGWFAVDDPRSAADLIVPLDWG